MAELRLNSEMNLLSTRYRVRSDCACRFKRQKWMVEVLRETSSDIGRIGPKGHERELLTPGQPLATAWRNGQGRVWGVAHSGFQGRHGSSLASQVTFSGLPQ